MDQVPEGLIIGKFNHRELNYVLEVPDLCITKLLDLFMLQDSRSAKLMCDESDLCQMFDYLHLLKGLEQCAAVTDCTVIRQ